MAGEQTARARPTTTEPNEATTGADANLPYGYTRVDRCGESQSRRPPPRQFNSRPALPRPAHPNRDLPRRSGQSTQYSAATTANAAGATTQPTLPAPPHQQRETRVVLQSRIFMGQYMAGDYLAHIQMLTDPNVNTMFPVNRTVAAPPPPQQMFKEDVDAARILVAMSKKDWEEHRKNGGS